MSRFKTVTFISRNAEGGVPYKCAVNDVQLSYLISVSEFTSDNVARVQRHAANYDLLHMILFSAKGNI